MIVSIGIQSRSVIYLQARFTECSGLTVWALEDNLINAAGVVARRQDGV